MSAILSFLSTFRRRTVVQWARAIWLVCSLVRLIGLNRTVMLLREARIEAKHDADQDVLCSEPNTLAANEGHAKRVRCEEHCTRSLCSEYIPYDYCFSEQKEQ